MSQKELDQIGIFEKLKNKEIDQTNASSVLHLSIRQVKRKLKEFRRRGAISLVHAARGKPGNRRFESGKKEHVQTVVKEQYPDFGPTFAAQKLLELNAISVNKETLRIWMSEAGIWIPRLKKQGAVHLWRPRRTCTGELVQLDGSFHPWFEGRAESCCLLAFIDDATSKLLWLELCEAESTECLMQATKHYLETIGRPVELYTDRGGVYKVNLSNQDEEKVTQYARALKELGIGLIFARSPQAKGRVERVFGTLQDRLVKELRLKGIASIEEANRYLQEEYLALHNAQFSVSPREEVDLHRSLTGFDLQAILCTKETRILQADWCLSYQNRWLQVQPKQPLILAKKEKITVSRYLNGSLHLSVRETNLAFKELTQRPPKPLREKQPDLRCLGHKPVPTHPWRHYYLQEKRDISKLLERDISILV